LEPLPPALELDVDSLAEAARLRAFNDTIHYVLPKLLLVASALAEGSARVPGRSADPGAGGPNLPPGIAEGTAKVEMVAPEEAGERLGELFDSIKQRHGHPLVSSYFRGLGNWPDFLGAAWDRLSPYVGSADYEARKRALTDEATGYAHRWPTVSAQVSEADLEQIGAIVSAFRLKFIPEMLLDATLIKALVDGREQALSSRFSTLH
jgi:hypothetical protein